MLRPPATTLGKPGDKRRNVMSWFADCKFCGAQLEERRIEYDYRRQGRHLVITNVPTGVCRQCGEKYFAPETLKKMDELYHDVFDRQRKPERVLEVPAVSF